LICGSPGGAGAVNKTLPAAEQSRPDVAEQRKQWPQRLADVAADRLVFVEESGANTQMTRRYGRSPIGQRLACPIPHGHYQTTPLVAGVRLQGPQAPGLFGGAMEGELFLAWVKQGLVLCLQPNEVVVMDNLATHTVAGVREAIEGAGARLEYLPPYSPDFKPIEPMWSQVKQGLKSQEPRHARQLHKAAGAAFAAVTPADCQGFFSHAGYAT
jgi:transposase